MGLSNFAILNTDGEYYTAGTAYTLAFRAPDYLSYKWNKISCEIYALFSSYMFIETNPKNNTEDFASLYSYTSKDEDLAWLLSLPMTSIRDLLNQVSKKFSLPLYEECKSVINYKKLSFNSSPSIANLLSNMVKIHESLDVRTLLLAFQIVSRTYLEIIKLHNGKPNMTIAYGAACIELANIINKGFADNTLFFWEMEFNIKYSISPLFTEIITDIIKITKGIIYSFSYWNYARCAEDIKSIVSGLINNKPIYVSTIIGDRNKNIDVEEIYNSTSTITEKEQLQLLEQPCFLDINPNDRRLNVIGEDKSLEDLIPLLLYNKEVLSKLELKVARLLYNTLINSKNFITARNYTLDKICSFNWRENKVLKEDVHPFNLLT